jgi:hypothetical protein
MERPSSPTPGEKSDKTPGENSGNTPGKTPGEKSDKPNDPPVEGGEDEAPPKQTDSAASRRLRAPNTCRRAPASGCGTRGTRQPGASQLATGHRSPCTDDECASRHHRYASGGIIHCRGRHSMRTIALRSAIQTTSLRGDVRQRRRNNSRGHAARGSFLRRLRTLGAAVAAHSA